MPPSCEAGGAGGMPPSCEAGGALAAALRAAAADSSQLGALHAVLAHTDAADVAGVLPDWLAAAAALSQRLEQEPQHEPCSAAAQQAGATMLALWCRAAAVAPSSLLPACAELASLAAATVCSDAAAGRPVDAGALQLLAAAQRALLLREAASVPPSALAAWAEPLLLRAGPALLQASSEAPGQPLSHLGLLLLDLLAACSGMSQQAAWLQLLHRQPHHASVAVLAASIRAAPLQAPGGAHPDLDQARCFDGLLAAAELAVALLCSPELDTADGRALEQLAGLLGACIAHAELAADASVRPAVFWRAVRCVAVALPAGVTAAGRLAATGSSPAAGGDASAASSSPAAGGDAAAAGGDAPVAASDPQGGASAAAALLPWLSLAAACVRAAGRLLAIMPSRLGEDGSVVLDPVLPAAGQQVLAYYSACWIVERLAISLDSLDRGLRLVAAAGLVPPAHAARLCAQAATLRDVSDSEDAFGGCAALRRELGPGGRRHALPEQLAAFGAACAAAAGRSQQAGRADVGDC